MVYSQQRLEGAITAINAEKIRLQEEKDEQYLRTHYRDDFAFRHTAKESLLIPTVGPYRNDGSDVEDADYSPVAKRTPKIHRQKALGEKSERQPRRVRRDPGVGSREVVCASLSSSFITLKFQHLLSLEEKVKLAARLQTNLQPSWKMPPITVRETEWATNQTRTNDADFFLADTVQDTGQRASDAPLNGLSLDGDLSTKPRGCLRSGKVRLAKAHERQRQRQRKKITEDEGKHVLKGGEGQEAAAAAAAAAVVDDDGDDNDHDTITVAPLKIGYSFPSEVTREAQELEQTRSKEIQSVCNKHAILRPPSGRSAQDAIVLEDSDEDESVTWDPQLDFGAEDISTITTSFAHPVTFGSTTTQSCDFCQDYRFGIVGYGKKNVTVTRDPTNLLQYLELGDGHSELNQPTTMCTNCVQDRISILKCHRHTVVRLSGAQKKSEIDYKAYALELTCRRDQQPKSHSTHVTYICSVCPRPAFFSCCRQKKHMQDSPQSRSACTTNGCGLLLCEICRREISARGGKLDSKVVLAVEKNEFRARADVGFLLKEGVLWKTCNLKAEGGDG